MSKILEELAREVEQKIFKAIQEGTAPWCKPWSNDGLLPHNPYTGTIYLGYNALRLMLDGYIDNQYLTFHQVKELNGYVKSGEKANYVLYAGHTQITPESKRTNQSIIFEDSEGNLYQKVFKKFPVFNISQCENIDFEKLQSHQKSKNINLTPKPRDRFSENPLIEQILQNSQIPIIHHQKDKAYYSPSKDCIYLPPKESFANKEQYYSTALHELGHATGHKKRLNRDLSGDFASPSYAKEELRAELYSFLQALELGIDYDLKNHASYVDGWLKALQNNTDEISKAMKDSVKMAHYIKQSWYPTKEQSLKKKLSSSHTKEHIQDIQKGIQR